MSCHLIIENNRLRIIDLHQSYSVPCLWPASQWNMRVRVALALVFLALAKVVNAGAPVVYKHAVDAIAGPGGAAVPVPVRTAGWWATPAPTTTSACGAPSPRSTA